MTIDHGSLSLDKIENGGCFRLGELIILKTSAVSQDGKVLCVLLSTGHVDYYTKDTIVIPAKYHIVNSDAS